MTATPEQVARCCTTHHLACDCRETKVKAVVEALEEMVDCCPSCGGVGYSIHMDRECSLCDVGRDALRAYRGEGRNAE